MEVDISYQTLHLPPPYAYAYTLKLDFTGEYLKVDFELEYLNRDELSEEEILDEGYSPDDQFSWSGILDPVWNQELKEPIANANLQEKTEEEINTWIHFDIAKQKSGIVTDPDEWEYRLQELIQAIYEKAGYENPLKMKFIYREKNRSTFYELTGSFASRTCRINNQQITWQQMQTLMSEVFAMDFDGEWVTEPSADGFWINPDGLSGYQLVNKMAGKRAETVRKRILNLLESAR